MSISKRDYEEHHESKQQILQSMQEDPICELGERQGCRFLKITRSREEWGIEYIQECLHLKCNGTCPLAK